MIKIPPLSKADQELHSACRIGSASEIRKALRLGDVLSINPDTHESTLHLVANHPETDCIKIILDAASQKLDKSATALRDFVNLREKKLGLSALHIAGSATIGDNSRDTSAKEHAINLLFIHGASLSTRAHDGSSPFMYADLRTMEQFERRNHSLKPRTRSHSRHSSVASPQRSSGLVRRQKHPSSEDTPRT